MNTEQEQVDDSMSSDLALEQQRYDDYIAERHRQQDVANNAAAAYDKAFLTLTGGGIALSFTLMSLVDSPPSAPGSLLCAWIAFTAALFLGLATQRVGVALAYRAVELHDELFAGKQVRPPLAWLINLLVILSLLSFLSALVASMVFAWANFVK